MNKSAREVKDTGFSYGAYPIFVDAGVAPETFYIDGGGVIITASLPEFVRSVSEDPGRINNVILRWEQT